MKEEMKEERKEKRRNDQRGQGLMEYVIISCLVGIFCIIAVRKYGRTLKNYTQRMDTGLRKELKTVFDR
ncbi:MAG: hypothetical protein OXB88_07595 [Bacteriovoracales bacterium]|nr:hypothetical protein [Bacteriovoracales bacterium]